MSLPGGREGFRCGTAVVLAGGAGRRMGGADKAGLQVAGVTMLDRVLAAARPLAERLVVVGARRPTTVPGATFLVESSPGGGPVPAVEAGLASTGPDAGGTALVLAVDLPLVTPRDLALLVEGLDDPGVDAVAAAGPDGRPNPLLAAYRVARIPRLGAGGHGAPAARLLPASVRVVELGGGATLNVNSPADLERARRLARRQD